MFESQYFQSLADQHRNWLKSFDPQHLANWEKLLNGNPEAAFCEATIRRRLQRNGLTVSPNEKIDSSQAAPDFRCTVGDQWFYVEATCVSIAVAVKKSGIPKGGNKGLAPFKPFGMTEAIFHKCGPKTKQCANLDAPALVAIGTFHVDAASASFKKVLIDSVLTGNSSMAWNVDPTTAKQVGEAHQWTELENAAFLRLNENSNEVKSIHSPVSGVLLCGLTLASDFIGVLHPLPCRPFDPSLLPGVEFGRVEIDRQKHSLKAVWPNARK